MLEKKIHEFKQAIEIYNDNIFYNKFWIIIASTIVGLQFLTVRDLLLLNVSFTMLDLFYFFLAFIISYLLTDFINGLVHLYMDNNTSYASVVGPWIAAFHLHHLQPIYRHKAAYKVYFYESGAKIWLPFYLLVLLFLQRLELLPPLINFCLVCIGILSSFAEVSHYWCHNAKANNFIISALQKYRILLSQDHHKHHHIEDNRNYAFLNGLSDPIINIIAAWFYEGYKNNADVHARSYTGKQTSNRS